jgi:photosystem II stability/assembly factor-like uncharacterized protein
MKTWLQGLAVAIGILPLTIHAEWVVQSSNKPAASFRAVQAVSEKVVWVSGTGGSCLRTVDGGVTWEILPVPGAERLDFRGLAAFDDQTALLMSSGDGSQGMARIYRTGDGGKAWELVFEDKEKGAFFDNICFWDKTNGMVAGDSVEGKFYALKTADGGRTWARLAGDTLPTPLPGEGAFAAGNSSMRMQGTSKVWISSGAAERSRVFISENRGMTWQIVETPMPAGESAGVFGMWFWDAEHGIGVGGDYKKPRDPGDNIILTSDGGRTWTKGTPTTPPGHKESAVMLPGDRLLAIGPSGTSLSTDFGKTWQGVDSLTFHGVSAVGDACWAVGNRGVIAKWK